jgi:hypothetical protein
MIQARLAKKKQSLKKQTRKKWKMRGLMAFHFSTPKLCTNIYLDCYQNIYPHAPCSPQKGLPIGPSDIGNDHSNSCSHSLSYDGFSSHHPNFSFLPNTIHTRNVKTMLGKTICNLISFFSMHMDNTPRRQLPENISLI